MRQEGSQVEQVDTVNSPEIQNELFVKEGFGVEKAKGLGRLYLRLHLEQTYVGDAFESAVEEKERLWRPSSSLGCRASVEEIDKAMVTEHENCFYLNSSDDIRTLARAVEVRGKSVLTIAGSGDFAQIFLHAGARSVDMVDISYPGVLFNEFKMAALQILDWSTFQLVFDLNNYRGLRGPVTDFVPQEIYRKVRPHLSQVCKSFFDELLQYRRKTKEPCSAINPGFARKRYLQTTTKPFFRQFIGDQVSIEMDYQRLQNEVRRTPVRIHRLDILNFCRPGEVPEVVYLSNVGYQPGITADLAKKFIEAGAERVYFSVDVNRINCLSDETGRIVFFHFFNKEGRSGRDYKLPFPPTEKVNFGPLYFSEIDIQKLTSGNMLVKFPNLIARVHGWTDEVEFGLTLEARKEDQ